MAAVVGAKLDRLLGARFPRSAGVEFHRHLVAARCLIECDQVLAVAQYADEGAVAVRTWVVTRLQQRGIDRHWAHQAAIDGAASAALDGKRTGPDKAVAIA